MNAPITLKRAMVALAWLLIALTALWICYDLWRSALDDAQFGASLADILFNTLFRTIPMVLLLLALALSVEVIAEESQKGTMQPRVRRWLYWTPRISVALFAALISLFSLDVFGEGYSVWQSIAAFLLHSLPTFSILLLLYIAWQREWVGGLLLIAWAIFYLVRTQGFGAGVYMMMVGLPFALGFLFLLNWHFRDELEQGQV